MADFWTRAHLSSLSYGAAKPRAETEAKTDSHSSLNLNGHPGSHHRGSLYQLANSFLLFNILIEAFKRFPIKYDHFSRTQPSLENRNWPLSSPQFPKAFEQRGVGFSG